MAKSSQAFRTIREVAEWLDVAAHVLRFWESKFPQIKPVKRAGGRRYYRPSDMELLGGIKVLLHDRGLTIRGVQRMIRENGVAAVAALSPPLDLSGVTETIEGDASEAWIEDAARDAMTTAAPPAPEAPAPLPAATAPAPDASPDAGPSPQHQPTLGMDLPLQPVPAPLVAPSAPPRPSLPAYPKPAQTAAQFPEAIGALAQLGARLADPARLSPATRARLRPELVALRDRMRAEPAA